ncbi:DsrH/TusB family sulfur relay protein [Actinobacillus delphinicola]|uniref:Sulfur transfer complex subunit TusB n=1 Tax=Actinobacillus delphinicola TaxID=51161 RepID=A0A448TTH9_9PAST|nr:DsrH/TusB family sulfur metabolism protein [Actinobacillus delphinicola]VEJ09314.1 sulfur transfer complex subunit TusB [Actinobacillus delphinicola]
MLYTFSQSQYDLAEMTKIWQNLTEQDVVLFWQNGVNFLVKNLTHFRPNLCQVCVLKNDVEARGFMPYFLKDKAIRIVTMDECVTLTEHYHPQLAF